MTDRITQLIQVYNRSIGLQDSLRGKRSSYRSRDLASRYNVLREDAKRLVSDPGFDRAVPPVWCLNPLKHIPLAIAGAIMALTVVYILFGWEVVGTVLIVGLGVVLTAGYILLITGEHGRLVGGSAEQVWDRTNMLVTYLRDYIKLNPSIASRISIQDERDLQSELDELTSENLALQMKLEDSERTCERLTTSLAGLRTPSQFDVPAIVLDKLDPVEKTRLLEAVQAYRVNAWTPAAAVCGMLLEGRLQRLCRDNGIPGGGIGDMIRRLGEAGLLKSYYQNLAKVGEFFRHRASHPTTEEFDREKATLVLTSLIILIREVC